MSLWKKPGNNLEKTPFISMKKETGKGDGKNPMEITHTPYMGYFSWGFFSFPSLSPYFG